jgi:hypothetical protein
MLNVSALNNACSDHASEQQPAINPPTIQLNFRWEQSALVTDSLQDRGL